MSISKERELQCLTGMSKGLSDVEIGRQLWLSVDTVKTYNRRLFRRIGARNRTHAVHRGWELGLLPFIPTPERSAL